MAKSRSRAVAPAMAEELPPRLRTAALATSANPREDRGGEGSTDQGQKRRRRRRSRKPRQDGGEGSTRTSSVPQPPAGE